MEEEAERIQQALVPLARGESTSSEIVTRWRRSDGSVFDGCVVFEVVPDESLRVLSAMIDHVSPMVPEGVGLRRDAFEYQHRMVCEWDGHGRIVYCNRVYREQFEIRDPGNGVGAMAPHLERERREHILHLLSGALKAHTSVGQHDHGLIAEWCDTPVIDRNGEIVSVLSVGLELTEKIHIEQSLRTSQRRFNLMATQLEESVLLIDPDGTILEAVGRPLDGVDSEHFQRGRTSLLDLIHPDDVVTVTGQLLAAADDPSLDPRVEVRLRRGDDDWSLVELEVHNRLADHDLAGLMVSARDGEDRRRIQSELDHLRTDAQEAERQRAAFVANVSRELRNPLHAILSTSELLTNSGLPARTALLADAILKRTLLLQRSVDDLLEFQQIRLGAVPLVYQDVDLVDLVDEAIMSARVHLFPGVTISARHDSLAPQVVRSDRVHLASVMFHLISNACKNTTHGTVTVTVMTSAKPEHVRIEVRDTGLGIASADIDRLFAPYERGHSDHPIGGLGLGLPIARGLTEMLGGMLSVSSRPGFGSTFSVELPIRSGGETRPRDDSTLRVLVVEDDPINQMITTHQLERLGASTEAVPDGETALIRLEAEHFDLIVLDIQLPGISGLEVARRCRRSVPRPYIAGISSASTATDRAACFEAGMDTFIPKPANLDSIRTVLESAEHHRTRWS